MSDTFLIQDFHPRWCETCRVIQQQLWMKECDILGGGGQNILWPLLHNFMGSRPPTSRIYAPDCWLVTNKGIQPVKNLAPAIAEGSSLEDLRWTRPEPEWSGKKYTTSRSFPSVFFPSVLWRCWLGDGKGIRPVKKTGCWFVGGDYHSPLSSNVIQNGDILVPANPGPPGKWPLKCTERGGGSGMRGDLVNVEVVRIASFGNGFLDDYDVVVQHGTVLLRRLVQVDQNARRRIARLRLRRTKTVIPQSRHAVSMLSCNKFNTTITTVIRFLKYNDK